jgi:hypothetical protein
MDKGQATQLQKILILAAIPHGLRLDKEIREIEECIRRAVRRDMFEVDIRTAVRTQDIRRAIAEEKPTIVHFCGHGLEDGSLLLEDDGGQNKAVPRVLTLTPISKKKSLHFWRSLEQTICCGKGFKSPSHNTKIGLTFGGEISTKSTP